MSRHADVGEHVIHGFRYYEVIEVARERGGYVVRDTGEFVGGEYTEPDGGTFFFRFDECVPHYGDGPAGLKSLLVL